MDDGTVSNYDNDLESYADWLLKERKKETSCPRPTEASSSVAKNQVRENKEHTLQLSKIEKKIVELQKKISDLDQSFADPSLYESSGADALSALQAEKEVLVKQLHHYEHSWYTALE